jgi:hypothetical protein
MTKFGGIVYNLDKLDPLFAKGNQDMKNEAEATAMHLKYGVFCPFLLRLV